MNLIPQVMNVGETLMIRINAAKVLLLFRIGVASDWASLCHAFGLDPDRLETSGYFLQDIVKTLLEANLIVADYPTNFRNRGNIKFSDNLPKIFTALDLSLKELAETDPHESMFVEPLFGRPKSIAPDERFDLFVLMPFNDNLKGVYEDHIKSVATRLELKVARADDFFAVGSVMKDIWTAICASRVIIADCTSRNPNVFYEIGLAHTVGKTVVLITQNSEDVPFDLKHYRYILYQYTPGGMKEFEDTLANTLETEFRKLKKL
jgi:hypothetical protein